MKYIQKAIELDENEAEAQRIMGVTADAITVTSKLPNIITAGQWS